MMLTAFAPLPTLWVRLLAGGWQVGFWIDGSGRTYVDVADPMDNLVHRAAGTRPTLPSIEAGWQGWSSGPDRETRCWALAVGHLPPGVGHAVSFTSLAGAPPADRNGTALPPDGWTGLRVTEGGLWVAVAIGCPSRIRMTAYSHVRLTTQAAALQYPLLPVGGRLSS